MQWAAADAFAAVLGSGVAGGFLTQEDEPAALRRSLGIKPGTQLEFEREGDTIRVSVEGAVPPSRIDEGYGLLTAARIRGQRRLSDFDPAVAMRKSGRR